MTERGKEIACSVTMAQAQRIGAVLREKDSVKRLALLERLSQEELGLLPDFLAAELHREVTV